MIVATTPRLTLKRFSADDIEGFFGLNQDEEVIRYTGDRPFHDRAEVARFIEEYDQYDRFGIGRWSVYLRQDNRYIGFSGLKFDPMKNELDIGFRFYRHSWGKGYATESAIAALHIGYEQFGAQTIVGRAMLGNDASHAVLKKLGMVEAFDYQEDGQDWRQYQLDKDTFYRRFADEVRQLSL